VAKDHIVVAPKPNETEVLIARERGPQAYPNGGPPAYPMTAFVRDFYPGEWHVRIPALGDAGATARVTFKGRPGWRCDCPAWMSIRRCKHWEAVFVKFGGRPFALPMPVCDLLPFPLPKPRNTRAVSQGAVTR